VTYISDSHDTMMCITFCETECIRVRVCALLPPPSLSGESVNKGL